MWNVDDREIVPYGMVSVSCEKNFDIQGLRLTTLKTTDVGTEAFDVYLLMKKQWTNDKMLST